MPADPHKKEMTDEQIADFLVRQGHGVLSFGGERPYSLPLSFGYDADTDRPYTARDGTPIGFERSFGEAIDAWERVHPSMTVQRVGGQRVGATLPAATDGFIDAVSN